MVYIHDKGEKGGSKRYDVITNFGKVEVLLNPYGESCMKINGTTIGEDLASTVLEELPQVRNPNLIPYANDILRAFGKESVPLEEKVLPLQKIPGYIRVRHYTTITSAKKIAQSRKLGGKEAPKKPDQGKIFVELAKEKPLSPRKAERKYGLKYGKGNAYIEFLVQKEELKTQINKCTGRTEYFIKPNSMEDKIPVYRIKSEILVVRRKP